MKFSNQIQGYIAELAERLGKTEQEVISLAVINFYYDKDLFVFSPYSDDMWLKEEIPSCDDVVKFVDSTGKEFEWVQFPDQQEVRNNIGARLRELRESAGLSMDQLSEKAGITKANISRIENGKYSPGLDILNKLGRALGKRVDFV